MPQACGLGGRVGVCGRGLASWLASWHERVSCTRYAYTCEKSAIVNDSRHPLSKDAGRCEDTAVVNDLSAAELPPHPSRVLSERQTPRKGWTRRLSIPSRAASRPFTTVISSQGGPICGGGTGEAGLPRSLPARTPARPPPARPPPRLPTRSEPPFDGSMLRKERERPSWRRLEPRDALPPACRGRIVTLARHGGRGGRPAESRKQ